MGFAIWNRPTNLVIIAPLLLFLLLRHRRKLLWSGAAMSLPLAAMAWYSLAYWGSIRALGQGIGSPFADPTLNTGFGASLLTSIPAMLFSPGRGLFFYSPVLLFAVPMVCLCWRKGFPPLAKYLAAGLFFHLLIFARWNVWWGGYSFGYRMLIEILPALIFFVALAWERSISQKRWATAAFWVAAAVSCYIQFLGAFAYPTGWDEIVDTNHHPERLWDLGGSELPRCQAKLLGKNWVGYGVKLKDE